MSDERTLFDLMDEEYPIDASSKVVPIETEIRLSRQERLVLEALLSAPLVSNAHLATLSLKYFSKISTLRSYGYEIELVSEDQGSGLAWYRLASLTPNLRTFRVPVEVRVPGLPFYQCVFTVRAISPLSARYRAWRAVKVIALSHPEEIDATA